MDYRSFFNPSRSAVSSDYQEIRGWEEGVVEHLQRLLRPTVLARMQITVPEEVFRLVEDARLFQFLSGSTGRIAAFFPISVQISIFVCCILRSGTGLLFVGLSQDWTASGAGCLCPVVFFEDHDTDTYRAVYTVRRLGRT